MDIVGLPPRPSIHPADRLGVLHKVMSVMREDAGQAQRLVPKARVPYILTSDNTTTPNIGQRRVQEYCIPLYRELVGTAGEAGFPSMHTWIGISGQCGRR